MSTPLDIARSYLDRGWKPIPIAPGEKKPRLRDWGHLHITSENVAKYFNGGPQNIGIQLGRVSGGLVDVDLDCAEAVLLAPHLLPRTEAIFGRASKPKSHYLYQACDEEPTAALRFEDVDGRTIAELRLGGGGKAAQTVFPGSIHPSGEAIDWATDETEPVPAEVSLDRLKGAVIRIAIGVLLMRRWRPGGRHNAAMRVGGLLARAGWMADDIGSFIEIVATAAGDDDPEDRGRTSIEVAENFTRGENTFGLRAFREHFGDEAGAVIARWLGYHETDVDENLQRMNDLYCVVPIGSKSRVLAFDEVPLPNGRRRMAVFYSFADFKNLHNHQRIRDSRVRLASWWLDHPQRRQYKGVIFRPGGSPVIGDHLNVWQGWGVTPRPGSWSLMNGHIGQVLAVGDKRGADYIRKWIAWSLQNPGVQAEVALVFRGGRGTGKGVFARALCKAFGQHGLHISSPDQLAGRFNAHMLDCALLFADEAYWPGHKSAEGTLKRLITEPTLAIERKGMDLIQAENCLHVIMAANEEWVVPAGPDERRFAVFDVSDARKQDKAYFDALYAEIENGGLAAMMHDLLTLDLGGWHPRHAVPKNAALREQQVKSLCGEDQWWLSLLEEGILPGRRTWHEADTRRVFSQELFEHARQSAPCLKRRTDHALAHYLRKRGCLPTKGKGRRGWEFPPLPEARTAWDKILPGTQWDDREDWEHEPL